MRRRNSFFFHVLFLALAGQLYAETNSIGSTGFIKDDQSFFSFGFSVGPSVAGGLDAYDLKSGEDLDSFDFSLGGVGGAANLFLDFRLVDNFSLQLEGMSKLLTGSHLKNEQRLSYPFFLSFSGFLNAKYQFEIASGDTIIRPFLGIGGGIASNTLRISSERISDALQIQLYDFFYRPSPIVKGFLGYKFLLGDSGFLDLALHVNYHFHAMANRDTTSNIGVEGDFQIDEKAMLENSENIRINFNPFITSDFLITFGWWL